MQLVKSIKELSLKGIAVILSFMACKVVAAQDITKVHVSTTEPDGSFHAPLWVWIIGVSVFILLLIALLRRGNKKEEH